MVLAFVGAGIFTMKNAMAIILGANLGTTLDSWLVASLGFKVNIEVASYPAVFVGGLLMIVFSHRKTIRYAAQFLLGFGLLFIALSFMKASMESQSLDFSKYAQLPLIAFLFIGFLITLIVQSSSVTMALTLSALHAGTISFPIAAAIVLGSETGTSIKIVLGAIGGNASKKRVAFGNLLFNVFLTVFAFVLLKPILLLITDVFTIKDPLYGLVTFSTLVNFLSIAIFLPFLNQFTALLERFFKATDASAAAFIGNVSVEEPETALDVFRKETEYFIHNSMIFNLSLFEIDNASLEEYAPFKEINEERKFISKTTEEKYEFLKLLQGELQAFYIELRTKLQSDQDSQLGQLIAAVRSSMYSVKSIKDIGTNIANLRHSSKDIKFDFFMFHKTETESLYGEFIELFQHDKKEQTIKLQQILDRIHENYNTALNNFYKEAQQAPLDDLDITTAINFNRELFTSNKAMLMAIKDLLLDEDQAQDFNEIPIYKA
jgi:phosphate:Na+ symporter